MSPLVFILKDSQNYEMEIESKYELEEQNENTAIKRTLATIVELTLVLAVNLNNVRQGWVSRPIHGLVSDSALRPHVELTS